MWTGRLRMATARHTFLLDTTSTLHCYMSRCAYYREVLAPGAFFSPRTYPKVDIFKPDSDHEAEYRDSDGNHVLVSAA